jgi:hypothetical protein
MTVFWDVAPCSLAEIDHLTVENLLSGCCDKIERLLK